jgi:dTDP-4-amino-4,6-dideoxy-D-galactose acyltransferase
VSLIEHLDWDSSFFGFRIGRVSSHVVASEDVSRAARAADAGGFRCTYFLVPASDHALLGAAQEHGFVVRDVRVELECAPHGHAISGNGLRRAGIDDLPALRPIAQSRFRGTRFFADPGFPAGRSSQLYVEWLTRALRESAPDLTVLMTSDASGFVVCELTPAASTGTIVLIAVDSDFARRGIGKSLVAGAGALFGEASLTRATVVTQGHNVAALRLYGSQGYRVTRVDYWLHRWGALQGALLRAS